MEVKISAELPATLDRMAAQQGRDPQSLVHEALERLVDYDEWFLSEVQKGLSDIATGAVLAEDDVRIRVEDLIGRKRRRCMLHA